MIDYALGEPQLLETIASLIESYAVSELKEAEAKALPLVLAMMDDPSHPFADDVMMGIERRNKNK